jgi:hypothetical protein
LSAPRSAQPQQPSLTRGPASPPVRATARCHRQVGHDCHPPPPAVPDPDSRTAARLRLGHASLGVARTPRLALGLYKLSSHPLGSSPEALAATKPLFAVARETLAPPPLEAVAPPPVGRREFAWELRKVESKPPVSLVRVADPYIAGKPSPEIRRRRCPPLRAACRRLRR